MQQIKKNPLLNSIPVIIYSTSANEKDIDELKRAGTDGYLVKKSDYTVLIKELHATLSQFSLV